ncbi:hypothetical protein PlfCFBP13513_03570 [Plantibacter flavus]|uniref:hypothetical protein n=1 Tax=Plantibacter flavus TaxID=150123 RepID=UPI0010C21954|nr:hypothetical protein [Plantibacter flavus]TKJ98542.1 hypothetical protein PlfCFBP13513_03570 [Plantibacter flavus]
MFGRRRHAAPVSASKLTEKQLFDLVHARLASELGANGAWVLSRRTPSSGDEIFHEVYAQQLAHDIATDIDLEQAAVTVRAEAAPARGWRLWSRGQEEAAVDVADEVETVEVIEPAVVEEPAAVTETIDAPSEAQTDDEHPDAAADDTEPTLVERTLLEPQHYPITVWAEPEFIDASLVNPVPARRSSVA